MKQRACFYMHVSGHIIVVAEKVWTGGNYKVGSFTIQSVDGKPLEAFAFERELVTYQAVDLIRATAGIFPIPARLQEGYERIMRNPQGYRYYLGKPMKEGVPEYHTFIQ